MKNLIKLSLLFVLIVMGCKTTSLNFQNPVTVGEKYVLPSGCCGNISKDTVEVMGFKEECVIVKLKDGREQYHNTKYFKTHVIPVQ